MSKRLTLEEIRELYENESREILDCEVRNYGSQGRTKPYVEYKCLIDGYQGWQALDNMKSGQGCPICGGTLKLTLEEIKDKLKEINPNIEILSDKYVNSQTKLKCKCLMDKHEWEARWNHLSKGHSCPKCSGNLKLTTEEAIEQFKEVHGDKYNYDKVEYKNAHTKIWIGCDIEGHGYFEQIPSNHLRGQGCPICGGKVLHDGNRISIIRPDLIKYFPNPKDADGYTVSSSQKVQLICPDCGKEKEISVDQLSKRGFSCSHCSDGISIGEKFGINLFKQLNIKFSTQKAFDFAKDKKYDMYFQLNNEEYIIEIHGIQHYEDTSGVFKNKTLKEQQENDLLKYNLAIQNGIKPENYIVIDARYSEFEYLKENFTKSLQTHFDLSNIDWEYIWLNSQKSILVEVCNYWKNKKEYEVPELIANVFRLSRQTIITYLKRGTELGLCKYNAKEEKSKSSSKAGKKNSKTTYQYSLNGEFIKKWESAREIERQLGFLNMSISQCCLGKIKTSNNFKWSYNPPINGVYPD